jgi:NAD-dependent SIR2 family protein deacetylase
MTEIYCLKCKKKTNQNDVENKTTKNGRSYISSKCSECGRKNCKFLKKDNNNNDNNKNDNNNNDNNKNDNNKNDNKDITDDYIQKKISLKKPRKNKEISSLIK